MAKKKNYTNEEISEVLENNSKAYVVGMIKDDKFTCAFNCNGFQFSGMICGIINTMSQQTGLSKRRIVREIKTALDIKDKYMGR